MKKERRKGLNGNSDPDVVECVGRTDPKEIKLPCNRSSAADNKKHCLHTAAAGPKGVPS